MNFKITKIKTKRGTERYKLRIWGRGIDAHQRKFTVDSRKDALEIIDRLQFEQKSLGEVPKSSPKFGDEYEFWLNSKARGFSVSWRANVIGLWKELKVTLESMKVEEVNNEFLAKQEAKLLAKGNKQKTVNIKIDFIRAILNHSLNTGRIDTHAALRYKKTKPAEPPIVFWEQADALSFLEFADQKYPATHPLRWVYVVYLVALNTGLRAGEIWALRPKCMRSNATMYIQERLECRDKNFYPPKGKGPRTVPMNQNLSDELSRLAASLSRDSVFFVSSARTPIDHKNFCSDIFHRDLKEWGGPKIKFHGLRHTAATLMLSQSIALNIVQSILGHKEIKMTMRYVHLLGKDIEATAGKFSVSPTAAKPEIPPPMPRHLRLVSV